MRGRAHAPVASLGETQVLPAQPPITVGSKYFQGLRPRKRPGGHHGQMGEHPAACPSDNTASCHKATDPSTQAEGQQPQPNRALLSSASSVTRHRQRGWTALNILEARVPHTSDGRVTCQAVTTIQMKTKNCKTNEKKKKVLQDHGRPREQLGLTEGPGQGLRVQLHSMAGSGSRQPDELCSWGWGPGSCHGEGGSHAPGPS